MMKWISCWMVRNFRYLGVTVSDNNDHQVEITQRINKINNNLYMLYPLMKDRNIPRKVKTLIYTSILRPVLTYGHESWTLTSKTRSQIQAVEMKVLRLIKGVTRLDRLRNEDMYRTWSGRCLKTYWEGTVTLVRPCERNGRCQIPQEISWMETRRNKTCWQTKNEMEGKYGYISEKKGYFCVGGRERWTIWRQATVEGNPQAGRLTSYLAHLASGENIGSWVIYD